MRSAKWSQGPGKGREPRTAPPTSPTGLARARRGSGLRPGWDGGSPSPRSGCAPGRRRVRPRPGLRPRARRPHAGLPLRHSAPGGGDCAAGAGNIRDLAPPPEAARLGGQREFSSECGEEGAAGWEGGECRGSRGGGTRRREGAPLLPVQPGLGGDPVPREPVPLQF